MPKASQPTLIHTLIIPTGTQFLLGRNGLILPVEPKSGHFRLDGTLSKNRVVLSRLSFPGDDVVIEGARRSFWLPHPFQFESFLHLHRHNLREGEDYVTYQDVGLYCVRNSEKGRLFEAAVTSARSRIAAEGVAAAPVQQHAIAA